MKLKQSRSALLLLLLPLLGMQSCATLLSSKHKGVFITSNVPGATVFDQDSKKIGETPFLYKPTREKVTLTVEKAGYASQQSISISQTEKPGFAFLDAMLLCIPCIVDYSTGAIYMLDKDTVRFDLKKVYPKDLEKVSLNIEDAEWKMKEGAILGKDGNEDIYFKKTFYESYIYKERICRGMNESRYEAFNCELKGGSDFEYIKKYGSLHLIPVISDFKMSAKMSGKTHTKTVEFNLKWKFAKSKEGIVIKELNEKVKKSASNIETKRLVASAIEGSLAEILNDDELYTLMLKESKNTDMREFTDEITIPKARLQRFEKTKDLFKHLTQGVVTIEHDQGHGSGFIISEDGYIVTNQHVIKGKKTVNVNFGTTMTLSADIIRSSEEFDVALIKLSGKGFTALRIGNSDSVMLGEDVIAIGTPADISLGQSVSKGIVSGRRKYENKEYIQTDVAANPGNSGGPLINELGEVIGMISRGGGKNGFEGLNFAIPMNEIIERLQLKIQTK